MARRFLATRDEVNEVLEEIKSDSCSFDEGTQMVLPSLFLPQVNNGAEDGRDINDNGPYSSENDPARQTSDRMGIWQPSPERPSANQAPALPPRDGVVPSNQMPRQKWALATVHQNRKGQDATWKEMSQEQQQQQGQQQQQQGEQKCLSPPLKYPTPIEQINIRDFSGNLIRALPDKFAYLDRQVPSIAELRRVARSLDQRINKTFGNGIETLINTIEQASEQHRHRPQPQIHPQFHLLQQKIEQQKQRVKGPNASPLTDPSVEGGLQDSISLEEYENPDVDDSEWEWIGPEG